MTNLVHEGGYMYMRESDNQIIELLNNLLSAILNKGEILTIKL